MLGLTRTVTHPFSRPSLYILSPVLECTADGGIVGWTVKPREELCALRIQVRETPGFWF